MCPQSIKIILHNKIWTLTRTLTQKQTNKKKNPPTTGFFFLAVWWKKTSNTQLQARNRCELSLARVLDEPPNMFQSRYMRCQSFTAVQEMVNNTKIVTGKDIGQDEGNGSPVNNKKRKKALNQPHESSPSGFSPKLMLVS